MCLEKHEYLWFQVTIRIRTITSDFFCCLCPFSPVPFIFQSCTRFFSYSLIHQKSKKDSLAPFFILSLCILLCLWNGNTLSYFKERPTQIFSSIFLEWWYIIRLNGGYRLDKIQLSHIITLWNSIKDLNEKVMGCAC